MQTNELTQDINLDNRLVNLDNDKYNNNIHTNSKIANPNV